MKFTEAQKTVVEMFESKEFQQRIKEEDHTMLKHLPQLQQINRRGYLTTESQAGRKYGGLSHLDGKPYMYSERAYLMGFMLEENAGKFIKAMGIHTDKVAVFTPACCNDVYIPVKLDIPLTIEETKQQVVTHTSMALPERVIDMLRKEVHLNKKEKVVPVLCWDPQWNRLASGKHGLFTEVLEILKKL